MNETRKEKLEWLRNEIQKGLDDLEAGRFCDGPEAMAQVRQRLLNLKLQKESRNASSREAE